MHPLLRPAQLIARRTGMAGCAILATLLLAGGQATSWLAPHAAWSAVLAALLSAAGLYLVGGVVSSALEALERTTEDVALVASGDLGSRATAASEGDADASRLGATLEQMKRSLIGVVSQARDSADTIRRAAIEIAHGNTELSERTVEQAADVASAGASIDQLAASARRNAATCRRACEAVEEVSRVAQEAAARMDALAATMGEVEGGAKRVAEITGVIEGIAFQTNILALNAAVEAARAGEQGRGFAVVAAEVRALAQRSDEAAKQIKALLGGSAEGVARGSRLAREAGTTLHAAVEGVGRVNELIGEVADASTRQSTDAESVRQTMTRIDRGTHQNAALAQQAASAASAFEDEAARLVNVVGGFRFERLSEREEAQSLVKRAAAHLRAKGLEAARADFEERHGGFMNRELYVFGTRVDGVQLFNARSRHLNGQSTLNLRDARGQEFVRGYIELARARGAGWHDYYHVNPVTGKLALKSAYVELVDDIVVGCGIYTGEQAVAPPRLLSAAE